jgi:hypothetical protein
VAVIAKDRVLTDRKSLDTGALRTSIKPNDFSIEIQKRSDQFYSWPKETQFNCATNFPVQHSKFPQEPTKREAHQETLIK